MNPYAYTVPASSTNPIRALVFDAATVSLVQFRVDGGTWQQMSRVAANPDLWNGTWNASATTPGNHTIEVRATGTSVVSNTISVEVAGSDNRAPVAANDSGYSVEVGKTLTIAKPGVLGNDSDPDGNALTAEVETAPSRGTALLNLDGSFTYTPSGTTTGTDTFTYRAYDAALYSSAATVSIAVNAATIGDQVTIVSAVWAKKTQTLTVTATSSAAPAAVLTVTGPTFSGAMEYNRKTKRYTYQKVLSNPPASVTVVSDQGGTATKPVTQK